MGTSRTRALLDPAHVRDPEAPRVISQVFEALLERRDGSTLDPGLARTWEGSADGRPWTFHRHPAALGFNHPGDGSREALDPTQQ